MLFDIHIKNEIFNLNINSKFNYFVTYNLEEYLLIATKLSSIFIIIYTRMLCILYPVALLI